MALPLVLACCIVWASGQPVPETLVGWVSGWAPAHADKAVHFFLFGALALLLARLRFVQERLPFGAMSAVVIVAGFGLSDEIHQAFTPGRSCSFSDWVADVLGALTFVTLYTRWPACRRWLEQRVTVTPVIAPPVPAPRASG